MKTILFILIITFSILFTSCRETTNNLENVNLQQIKVEVQEKYPVGNFEDFFSSSKVISLESNEHSIFYNIDRLILHRDKIFVLDKKSNSILIFSNTGKFLNKICTLGKGPREYRSLYDFTIDDKSQNIILYSDRPYKLITYNIEGVFLKEEKLNDFYFNMAFFNDKLLFLSNNLNSNKMLCEYDLSNQIKNEFIEMNEKDRFFYSLGMPGPKVIKGKNINISLPYSETIYRYDKKGVLPKYYIDFDKNKTPNNIINIFDKEDYYKVINKYIKENRYGFGISNFRENKNYVTFNYWGNMIVIYSKISKKAKAFSSFISKKDPIPFYNYFAHDGDDNNLISIYPSIKFKRQMKKFKKNEEYWKEIPDHLKTIDKGLSISDNPLLLIYTFKE